MKGYGFAVLAYLLPTFALGFVWHLVLFQSYYEALAIYRRDVIIPFGFLSMLIQAATFALVYEKAFARSRQSALQIAALRRCGCSVLVELHDAGRRGDEPDGLGARLCDDRDGLYDCSVGTGGAVHRPLLPVTGRQGSRVASSLTRKRRNG